MSSKSSSDPRISEWNIHSTDTYRFIPYQEPVVETDPYLKAAQEITDLYNNPVMRYTGLAEFLKSRFIPR